MSYTRTQWVESETPLSADNMNNIEDGIEELQDQKVDKATGKGLSTNDYTTAEKNKLAGIETGAEVNPGNATTSAAGLMSASDKTKLNGIQSGANNYALTKTLYTVNLASNITIASATSATLEFTFSSAPDVVYDIILTTTASQAARLAIMGIIVGTTTKIHVYNPTNSSITLGTSSKIRGIKFS